MAQHFASICASKFVCLQSFGIKHLYQFSAFKFYSVHWLYDTFLAMSLHSAHPVLYRLYKVDLEIGLIPLGVFSPALRLSCLPVACSNINISWTLQRSARFLWIGIENIQHNYLWNMVRKAKCRSWSYQEWFQFETFKSVANCP